MTDYSGEKYITSLTKFSLSKGVRNSPQSPGRLEEGTECGKYDAIVPSQKLVGEPTSREQQI